MRWQVLAAFAAVLLIFLSWTTSSESRERKDKGNAAADPSKGGKGTGKGEPSKGASKGEPSKGEPKKGEPGKAQPAKSEPVKADKGNPQAKEKKGDKEAGNQGHKSASGGAAKSKTWPSSRASWRRSMARARSRRRCARRLPRTYRRSCRWPTNRRRPQCRRWRAT